MSRVEIEAGGRRIVVDADEPLHHTALEAQRLWDHTAGAAPTSAPGFGFVQPERRTSYPATESTMRRPPPPIRATDTDQAG